MKLSQLLSIYPQLKFGDAPTQEVQGISHHSNDIKAGFVFVAIKGERSDGHDFLKQVVDQGAIALVVERDEQVPKEFLGAQVKVEDSRHALDKLASRYFGEPARELFCVGITGTNGKTSVAYMVEAVLAHFGWKTGVMGTIDHHIGDHKWASQLTTPDALVLHRRLREFKSLGAEAVVMEVSSHSLVQKRVDQIPFSAKVFTNLSRDHLDYHKNMEEYFLAKERLFVESPVGQEAQSFDIVNGDDAYGQRIQLSGGAKHWTFGVGDNDFQWTILEEGFAGTRFDLRCPRGQSEIFLPMVGRHNVYNAVAAVAVGIAAGASLDTCCEAIGKFSQGIPGRLEKIKNVQGTHVFVDFAHTDAALSAVLQTLAIIRSKDSKKSKIITVYGCGGDRDKGKRKLMAQAALADSDFVVVTSDNPRSEDPHQIIADSIDHISEEVKKAKLWVEVSRKEAIHYALKLAEPEDIVLVAGKGHEDFQLIDGKKAPFSDQDTIKLFFKNQEG